MPIIEAPGPAADFQPGRQRRVPLALVALVLVLILGGGVLALSVTLSSEPPELLAGHAAAHFLTATAVPSVAPTPTNNPNAFEIAEQGVNTNAAWEAVSPVVREFYGVEMVLVPAGCFMMGSQDGADDERPVHEICFDEPFWIDRYEVSWEQYIRLGGQRLYPSHSEENPVEEISWFSAHDFCVQRDIRLPTEAEWEYAARGPDSLAYPWGNEFVPDNVIYFGNSDIEPALSGSRPGGVSWIGTYDMSGNVSEWTSSIYADYPYVSDDGREDISRVEDYRVMRGGSFVSPASSMRAAHRNRARPLARSHYVGFRCAQTYTPTTANPTATPTPTASPTPTALPPTTTPTVTWTPRPNSGLSVDQIAEQGVVTNAEWQAVGPVVQQFDGVEMVLVRAGCFMMGSTDRQLDYAASIYIYDTYPEWLFEKEQPVHRICFNTPFWIDRYEVTNEQYGGPSTLLDICFVYSSEPRQPRNCVDWIDAYDFCQERDARLPTEAEWEYAARGPDSLIYPWGNEFIADNVAQWDSNVDQQTALVGSRPAGVSWVGAYDMSGNVSEWTSSIYADYPYASDDGRENISRVEDYRVMRGGSLASPASFVRSAYRQSNIPHALTHHSLLEGFRCARDYQP